MQCVDALFLPAAVSSVAISSRRASGAAFRIEVDAHKSHRRGVDLVPRLKYWHLRLKRSGAFQTAAPSTVAPSHA